jgi:hypothetical protein
LRGFIKKSDFPRVNFLARLAFELMVVNVIKGKQLLSCPGSTGEETTESMATVGINLTGQ